MTVQPASSTSAGRREWTGLALLALPTLLIAVDNSVLFLALPQLSADLHASSAQQLWIADIYGFVIAGFLVTMGTVGDRIGHRRLLMGGAVAFGIASVLAAYSVSAPMLIVTRALLGLAGAALMPSILALISMMFRDPAQRTVAIAVWTSCFMAGAAIGPLVGGILLNSFFWGSVFLMAVPVMALVVLLAPALVPDHDTNRSGRIDLISAVLSVTAILPVIYGLKEIASDGPGWPAFLSVAAGIGFGTLFLRRQRRLTHPMLDLHLFGNRSFSSTLGILVLGMVLQGGTYLLVSQYLQLVEGLPALRAGLWLIPPALALVVGSLLTPMFARRFRPGPVIAAGLVISAVGFLLLTQASGAASVIIATTIAFLGSAPVGTLGVDLIVGSSPPEKAGAASSIAETGGELGIAVGIAVLGSISAAVYRIQAGNPVPAGGPVDAEAFTAGLTIAAATSAVIAAGLAILAIAALRRA